jgi:hypothetical protein
MLMMWWQHARRPDAVSGALSEQILLAFAPKIGQGLQMRRL